MIRSSNFQRAALTGAAAGALLLGACSSDSPAADGTEDPAVTTAETTPEATESPVDTTAENTEAPVDTTADTTQE